MFIYTGIMGLYENHFWERIKIAFAGTETAPTDVIRQARSSESCARVHSRANCVRRSFVGHLKLAHRSDVSHLHLSLDANSNLVVQKFNMFSAEWLELLDAKGGPPRKTDEDNQIMEDRKENKWLLNAPEM